MMKVRSIVKVAMAVAVAGCASSEPGLAPSEPMLAKVLLGNPPPPRVLGKIIASFSIVDPARSGAAQTFTFNAAAHYNRDTTAATHFLELTPQAASIRANANGVQRAVGIATLVGTGATLTVDLTQLIGFTGPLFLPCPVGAPVNCFIFNATLTGTITLANGTAFPAIGTLRFRWETPGGT